MNEIIIIFASATTAARIKKHLSKLKYYAKVTQTPKHLSPEGCSYSVYTTENAIDAVKEYAKFLDVTIKAIYKYDGTTFSKIRGVK